MNLDLFIKIYKIKPFKNTYGMKTEKLQNCKLQKVRYKFYVVLILLGTVYTCLEKNDSKR